VVLVDVEFPSVESPITIVEITTTSTTTTTNYYYKYNKYNNYCSKHKENNWYYLNRGENDTNPPSMDDCTPFPYPHHTKRQMMRDM
jgi:hypothetical protein